MKSLCLTGVFASTIRKGTITVLLCFVPFFASAQIISPENLPEATGWKQEVVLEGLEHPWGIVFLSESESLITERPGRLRMVRDGQLKKNPISGVPEVFAAGQGGLLDIALDPQFAQNRYVYLTYSAGTSEHNRTTLGRGRLQGMELKDFQVLFETEPPKSGASHFGSRILFLPDRTLLVSIGDGGNPPLKVEGILAREHAQRLDSHLGSIIRLNPDGTVPEDNPFIDQDEARPEIYTFGHRNIQGLALDTATGQVWANEHGPFGGDELNLIQVGQNYGWPLATHGRDYRTGERFTPHKTLAGKVPPKLVWTPAQAPSGLSFYTGRHFSEWQGDLFSGGLRGQQVRRIIIDGKEVKGEEKLSIAARVRAVVQGPDDYLYVLTDAANGKLLRIVPED